MQYAKAIKNDVELQGFRTAHQRDAVALVRYFAWLEHQLLVKSVAVSEAEGADQLEAFRRFFWIAC